MKGYACAADFYDGITKDLPDMVLLDVMLPNEDGLSILKKLRMRKDTAQIPVIMATAKGTDASEWQHFYG